MNFSILDFFEWVIMEIAWVAMIGFLFQFLSHRYPFRQQEKKQEIMWDIIAMVFSTACVILYGQIVGGWMVSTLTSISFMSAWHELLKSVPWIVLLLGTLLLGDFIAYWSHRIMHTTKMGWQQHAWHHTPKHIWWMSGLRGTPAHLVMTFAPYTFGNIIFLAPHTEDNGALLATAAIIGILNQHIIHSNIHLPFASIIEKVLVTPRFHFVHHSADIRFTNSNYGFIFSFWDKAFGSYTNPDHTAKEEQLGLDYRADYVKMILGLPHIHLPEEENSEAIPEPNK